MAAAAMQRHYQRPVAFRRIGLGHIQRIAAARARLVGDMHHAGLFLPGSRHAARKGFGVAAQRGIEKVTVHRRNGGGERIQGFQRARGAA